MEVFVAFLTGFLAVRAILTIGVGIFDPSRRGEIIDGVLFAAFAIWGAILLAR